jgi:sugar lactone lactonase YvrE
MTATDVTVAEVTTDATTDVTVADVTTDDGAASGDLGGAPDRGAAGCAVDRDCDDGVPCTDDLCVETRCRHTAVPGRCAGGQTCDPRAGCVGGRVCATDRDCADADPCTVRERCDPATRLCRADPLDGDADEHAPRVCGGDDCDDGNAAVFRGAEERCNGVDDDCDGVVDGAAATRSCASAALTCQAGACGCENRALAACGGACVDLASSRVHCGRCGNDCGPAATCSAGTCTCSAAGLSWCSGVCASLANDVGHCGRCGHACAAGEACAAGACGPVVAGPACEMATPSAPSRVVLTGLAGARDFAFDGRGGVAVALGATVVLRRGPESSPVAMVMPGEVVALRFTRASGLMIAVFNDTGSGTGNGAIYRLPNGATTATVRQSGLRRPGGLAVDANDDVWFSDTAAPVAGMPTSFGLIYRMPASGGAVQVVVTDVRSPTHLLVDYQGRYLLAARSDTNSVVRVALSPGGTVEPATEFVGGFSLVTGLAQDECGNVYVADDLPDLTDLIDRVWRISIGAGAATRVITDVRGPRSLTFGAGDPFGPRELYTLSSADGTLRAANLVLRGVAQPVPAP